MARTSKAKRLALTTDGRLQLIRAVAYERQWVPGGSRLPVLMLSVYVKVFAYLNHDRAITHEKAERMYVPRTTTQEEQLSFLEAMTYRVALQHEKGFKIVVEASLKVTKENKNGIQRP